MENPSRVALLKQFNWKKVALLVQNLDIYVLVRCVNRFSGARSCARREVDGKSDFKILLLLLPLKRSRSRE